jgi:putative membrane protein
MKTAYLLAPALLIAAPAAAQVMSPSEYVATAGASDLYERSASELVLQTTADPKVRDFARAMIAQHTESTAMVKAAAMRAGLHPRPPMLTPLQNEMLAELRATSGPARDAAYLAQQKAAHGQALDVQQAYASEGLSAPLRAAAAKIVPVVQSHVRMLMTMAPMPM